MDGSRADHATFWEKKLSNPRAAITEREKRAMMSARDGVRIISSIGILKSRLDRGVKIPVANKRERRVKVLKKFLKGCIPAKKEYNAKNNGMMPIYKQSS